MHPVRNKFPTLALEKLKTEVGRARFTISMFSTLMKLRISSFLGEEMSRQSSCRASTMSSHSCRASLGSVERR